MIGVVYSPDPNQVEKEVSAYALVLLATAGVFTLGGTMDGYFFTSASEHLTRNLRSISLRSLLRHEVGYFDDDAHSPSA